MTSRANVPSPGSEEAAAASLVAHDVDTALGRARPLLASGLLLLASDFDGTLSRPLPDPWAARIIPGAQRALRQLAGRPRVHVALISGRTVADLAERARIGGISYRGDHGAERAEAARGMPMTRLRIEHEPVAEADRRVVARLAVEVPQAVPEPWLVVERKRAAVTFHFRAAPDLAQAASRVGEIVAAIDMAGRLERHEGRRVLELRPRGATTKAAALRALVDAHRPASVIMLGDDPHDARAFDLLRAARSSGELDGLAIAVTGRPEVTARVVPHADIVLRSPVEVARFLGRLAATPPLASQVDGRSPGGRRRSADGRLPDGRRRSAEGAQPMVVAVPLRALNRWWPRPALGRQPEGSRHPVPCLDPTAGLDHVPGHHRASERPTPTMVPLSAGLRWPMMVP